MQHLDVASIRVIPAQNKKHQNNQLDLHEEIESLKCSMTEL